MAIELGKQPLTKSSLLRKEKKAMCKILDKINTPKDLKILSRKELVQLCGEIRQQMLLRLSATGGHVGSNLAMIEATVALHYVFDSPIEKQLLAFCYCERVDLVPVMGYTVV